MLRSVLDVGGWGSATSELDAAPVATDVTTSAVEDAAAEHALVCELARPQRRFRLSVADGAAVRRIVGDRDYRYPRRPRHAPRRGRRRRVGRGAQRSPAAGGYMRHPPPVQRGRSTRGLGANALIHGRPRSGSACGARRTASWPPSADRGDGPADPFAGLLPVTDTSSAGLGLWLTHQLCSHVTLDTTDDGFTIRLVVGTPQPGRSGHAPDTA